MMVQEREAAGPPSSSSSRSDGAVDSTGAASMSSFTYAEPTLKYVRDGNVTIKK
jgi:hypothetical protein